jgi:hypothetical protein
MQEDILLQKEIIQVFQDQELKKVQVVVEQVLPADLQHPVTVELVEQEFVKVQLIQEHV